MRALGRLSHHVVLGSTGKPESGKLRFYDALTSLELFEKPLLAAPVAG
jgi:hypothetical protein